LKILETPYNLKLKIFPVFSKQTTGRPPNSSTEKWDNRLSQAARFATKLERPLIPLALLTPFVANWFNNSQFTSKGLNTPDSLKIIQSPGLPNFILDFLSMFGEYKGGFSMIGNAVRVIADILLFLPKDKTHNKQQDSNPVLDFINGIDEKFVSTIYLFASALIAIGWSFDTNTNLRNQLNEETGLLNKLKLQKDHYLNYWSKELPEKLTNKTLLKEKSVEFRKKPFESIGNLARHSILLHSALSFLALPFIVAGSLLNNKSINNSSETPESKNESKNQDTENNISRLGWFIASLARLPLVFSTFASAFNKDQRQAYTMLYSIASGMAGLLAMARVVFPWSTWLDFLSNTVSTSRSYISRNGRNNN
jgi:hypothetical protein